VSLETDAQGIVRVPLGRDGLWNVRTLHIVPAPARSGVDWDSHFATLVFAVAPGQGRASADSAAVIAVVARYHAALASGDSATALRLLALDAVILESGGMETVAEYRAHHLPADIAFAAGVPAQRTVRSVVVRGDAAWVASTSVSQGEFRGRAVNSAGAELMVLARTGDGWRITAIHWSSRTRRP
jgi:ketosteroid isomerase-like protein